MTKERLPSFVFLIIGIYGLFFSVQLPMGKWDEPGPGVFPLGISILLFLSGIIWFIKEKSRNEEKARITILEIVKDLRSPLKILGLTAVFIVGLQQVGYLAASTLYIFLLLLWVSRYKFWTALGAAVLIAAGSWYFFGRILSVQLP